MLWLEEREENETQRGDPGRVLDYAYRIHCHSLPVEHAYPLKQAITAILPWIAREPGVGIHDIHVAASGNGWTRPGEKHDDGLLYLSRRTRLVLRLPKSLLPKARALEESTLVVGESTLVVGKGQLKPLLPSGTLFARYVAMEEGHEEESRFVDYLVDQLQRMGISPRKVLCGRTHAIRTPETPIRTRSVLIAELSPEESVRLQQNGIGPNRRLGCGLFIPHKGIAPVSKA